MDFISWNDFIQPTNPKASIYFGLLFTVIVTLAAWYGTKEKKTVVVVFIAGLIVVIFGILLLNVSGYYD